MAGLRPAARLQMVKRLGGRCAECQTTEALELDHVDPFTRRRRDLSAREWLEDEQAGHLQVLCNGCHRLKSVGDRARKQGVREHWEHGTLTGYFAMKCKCAACLTARDAYAVVKRAREHAARLARLRRRPR